jgi:molecular chaperone GrpE
MSKGNNQMEDPHVADNDNDDFDAEMADEIAAAEADAAADAALDGIYSDEEAAQVIAAAEIAELKDKLLRAVAETENVRRRGQRDQDDARKFAVTDFARDILSVADNLYRAVSAVPAEVRAENTEVANLLEGVELTARELNGTMERHGIKLVNPMGEKLDPNQHQAVMQIEDPEAVVGTVIQVMQVGYVLNGRLLRPAMVGVAKGGPAAAAAGDGVDTKA